MKNAVKKAVANNLMRKVLVLAGLAVTPTLANAQTHDATWRLPIVTIPLLQAAPQIDGTIGEEEWSRATLLPELTEVEPAPRAGLPSRYPSHVWMGYTKDAMYIAWRQELPPESLPESPKYSKVRDMHEGADDSVNVLLADGAHEEQFNISGNADSSLFDRRLDNGEGVHWNPDLTYRSHVISTGWEGELEIPFKELGLPGPPAPGTQWKNYFYSTWRGAVSRNLSFPYVRWRGKGEYGALVFGGDDTAIRFDAHGIPQVLGGAAEINTQVFHRKAPTRQAFYPQVVTAQQNAQVEGGTFASLDTIIGEAVTPFEISKSFDAPGEYLVRYDITRGARVIARGVQPFYLPPPLSIEVTPRLLNAGIYSVEASSALPGAKMLRASLLPAQGKNVDAPFKIGAANLDIPAQALTQGKYQLVAEAMDGEKVIARQTVPVEKPAPPDWWTLNAGRTPLIPPPWTAVKATAKNVEVLGRRYDFSGQPVPSQITTKGRQLFASPPKFVTKTAWKNTAWKIVSQASDAVIYQSENVAGNLKMKATTRVEFDGFIRVDLDLSGTGETDLLDLVLPFKKEQAILLANYVKAPGPGDAPKTKRFTNVIPEDGVTTPPMITTWIGTDYCGLETALESTRGWAMSKPNEASVVMPSGDKVLFTLHLISKPIQLRSKARRITFGMTATPTKPLTHYLQHVHFYDDMQPYLTPYDWSGDYAWHPPLKDPVVIARNKKWIDGLHEAGQRPLVNGGWNVSTTAPQWENWGREMTAEPLQNVSFDAAKQFAACYRSPYSEFMVNSFAYNAKLLKFDGIRFDTVTPGYICSSLYHHDANGETCGWYDDDGKLWPTINLFAQREMMKRIYRVFHGEVIKDGAIQLPNAGPPLALVHSFADHHEIGEGFYQTAKTLKEGYDPGFVRALMAGNAYGLRTENSIKDGPLFSNERIAALLVGGAEPRWEDYRMWKPGYEAHARPAPSVWDAWDWVDKWNAEFLGWWNNGEYVQINKSDPNTLLLASLYLNRQSKRVLLTVTNYEKDQPLTNLEVKLNLQKLGFSGKVFAEDAITFEPVELSESGLMKLDVLGQRYRLIEISNTPSRYRGELLGDNLLATMPLPAKTVREINSPEIKVAPDKTYVLSAWIKIDANIGEGSDTPNFMGKFSPTIRQYASLRFAGDVNGINGTHTRALTPIDGKPGEFLPYAQTDLYKRNFTPQLWEKTGGWTRVWVPVKTGAKATTIRVIWGTSDTQVVAVKDWALREVH